MGILRTDKISGLETPTAAVTGSVYFDGSDDFLTLPDSCGFDSSVSYTVEMWVKDVEVPSGSSPFFTFGASGATNQTFNVDYTSAGNLRLDYYSNAVDFPVELNDGNWHHIAATYDGTTRRLFADGRLGASDTTTSGAYVADNVRVGRMNWISRFAKCYISNLRVVTGTALYTSDFTVPTHALEVIDGTILLCCNNKDNAAAIDHANIGVSKSITVNGGAAVSTDSPGLTRDFTSGTEFKGVTTFDTQGYFVPPSGTTEQRGRGRGLFAIAGAQPASVNAISYIQISSEGNAQDFGDLSYAGNQATGVSSPTRAIFNNGNNPGDSDYTSTNVLDFVTIATTSNSSDFGDLTTYRYASAPLSNSTRGVFVGGNNEYTSPYPTGSAPTSYTNTMDYITMAALGNAIDFGDAISSASSHNSATSNSTRGVYTISFNGSSNDNSLYYITIATTGNGQDFGNLSYTNGNRQHRGVISNGTRGIFGGALVGSNAVNNIDFITIATLGNGQDFGDLSYARRTLGGTSNSVRGIFAGGYDAPPGPLGRINTIDYINIASTGDAQEFGDLIHRTTEPAGASDSHGGLS